MSKSRRTYKYRLWPNRKQREVLFSTLEVCRQLYNDALKERREAWELCRTCVSFSMQSAQLPACKAADPALGKVYSQVLQDVLHRVDKTYQAFFRRGRGFPRFKGQGWFDSFTYPQAGFRVNGGQLSLSKIGNVKIKLHRSLQGEVKTLTLKNENGQVKEALELQWSETNQMFQSHAIEVLHYEEDFVLVLANLEDRADTRMIEGRSCAGLASKAIEGLRIFGQLLGQKL